MRDLLRQALLCGMALGALVAADAGVATAAAGQGSAKGRTAQGRVVRLRVNGEQLKLLSFTAELRCRDGSLLIDRESGFLPTRLNSGGRFSDRQFGSTDVVRFKGKVTRNRVNGRIRVTDSIRVKNPNQKKKKKRKVRCDSHWFSFHARIRH